MKQRNDVTRQLLVKILAIFRQLVRQVNSLLGRPACRADVGRRIDVRARPGTVIGAGIVNDG